MTVRLLVKQRSEAGGADSATEVLLDEPSITLGRDEDCNVVLAQKAVSRKHARISRDGTLFFAEDLGSAYGTQINGKKLAKGEKKLLRNGDVIAIAQFDLVFDRVAASAEGTASSSAAQVARQVVKDVMRGLRPGGEAPYLRVMNGALEGKHIQVNEAQELLIGREDDVDIVLVDDDLVSRHHAKVRRDWSGTHVEDLGSRNGIRVNKKRVTRKTLRDRDELEVGGTRLLFVDPTEVREAPVVLPEDEGEATTFEPEPEPEPEKASTAADVPAAPEPIAPEPVAAAPEEPAAPVEEPGASGADEGDGDEEEGLEEAEDGGAEAAPVDRKKQLVPVLILGAVAVVALTAIIAVLVGA